MYLHSCRLVPTFTLCPSPFTSGTVSVQDLTEAQTWAPVTSWEEFRWHWDSLCLGTRHTVPLVVSGQGQASVTDSSHLCPSRALLLGWRAWLLACPTSGLTPPHSPQCQPVAASICSTLDTKAPGDDAAVRSVYLSLNTSYVSVNFCGWTNWIEF